MKRLVRPKHGRVIAGVCAAFANYLNVDVVFVRVVAVLLLLPGGLPGLLPYVIGWVIIPEEQEASPTQGAM